MLRSSLAVLVAALSASAQDGISSELVAQRAFFERYCFDCHGGDVAKGKLDLAVETADPVARLFRMSRLSARVGAGEMPPPDPDADPDELPTAAERAALVQWVEETLWNEVPQLAPAPGRITVRRLNATQWERTVRDLLGVTVSTAGFPADDLAHGFDTIGDAMSFSTLHLEKYLGAAADVAASVFHGQDPDNPTVQRFEAELMEVARGSAVRMSEDRAHLLSRVLIEQRVSLPYDGVYRLRVSAASTSAGDEAAKMLVQWDGEDLDVFEVPERDYSEFELKLSLTAGPHRVGLAFTNDYYDPKNPDRSQRDRNLHIDWCEVIGPLDALPVPAQQQWLHELLAALPPRSNDSARVAALTKGLLPRLWRRPARSSEIKRYTSLGEQTLAASGSLTDAFRVVLQAALTSPNFLFRGEVGGTRGRGDVAAKVPSNALASRLSYFLWASAPDAALARLGRSGKLTDRETLLAEARRLLADPRADSLATEFAAQWLELKNLADVTPDPGRFPDFDDALRRSLRTETEQLFLAVQRDDRDVRELLDCDFTFVDRRLAEFYGVPFPTEADGEDHVRVVLPAAMQRRGGVLGHGSILAVTSNPTRTSPVKRGKWILENLLGEPPPPPPPGNDSLPDEQAIDSSRSFREQMAQHREDRKCAVCHLRMDALGLSLERFDAIGRYREEDKGGVIDASGELPGGRMVDGLVGLKEILRSDPAFVRTFARKLFVYAIGRDPRKVDRLVLDRAVASLLRQGKVTVADLVLAIVDSDAFRLRSVEAPR